MIHELIIGLCGLYKKVQNNLIIRTWSPETSPETKYPMNENCAVCKREIREGEMKIFHLRKVLCSVRCTLITRALSPLPIVVMLQS